MSVVLVADDEVDILDLLRIVLSRAGHEVVAAHDGEEALRLVADREPALAVLDVSMPKLDGLEVTRRLRSADETRELPVILLSARAQPSDVELGLAVGANAYLCKPVGADELREQVASLL